MIREPVTMLLADDNEDDIVLIEEALSDAKTVRLSQVVRNGAEAMAFLRQEVPYDKAHLPGLVLLDINMPKNGLDVLREIKADKKLRHIPVIMLTISSRAEDVIESYASGASSFVRKPLAFAQFQEKIRQFAIYWSSVSTIPNGDPVERSTN